MLEKTVIVTGANGLLGQKLIARLASRKNLNLIATGRGPNGTGVREGVTYRELDLCDTAALRSLVEESGATEIVNCGAMTQVDACETDREKCREVNTEAVARMANLCAAKNIRLIHISTDFVFDGEAGPYDEKATPNPLSWYGECKWESEKAVMESGCAWVIIRTVLVFGVTYGNTRSNIVLWAKGALERGEKIRVVNDQWRSPTLSEDLAEGVALALMKDRQGLYHISGPELMSVAEIVYRIADFWGLDKSLITEIDSASLAQPAKRPPKTGFVLLKAQTELGYKPRTFEEGLHLVDRQLGGN